MIRKWEHRAGFALLKLCDFFFSALPLDLAFRVGAAVGVMASKVMGHRSRLVIRNLENAFPEKSRTEIETIARAFWRNLGRTAAEFVRLPTLVKRIYPDQVTFEGSGWDVVSNGTTGHILVGGHFTNWELAGALFEHRVGKMTAIARPIKNPYVDAWIQKKRSAAGVTVFYHRDAVRGSLRALHQKRNVAILFDQNLYTGGVFVTYFGRPVATTTLPALLYSRTEDPVVFFFLVRNGNGFRFFAEKIVLPAVEDAKERLQRHTQIINTTLEESVRRYPESWFWIHNRWKRTAEAGGKP